MFWCAACGVVLRVTPTKKRMRRDGKNMEKTFERTTCGNVHAKSAAL